MKKYLVINIEDANDFYIVDSLDKLISEMYEPELYSNSFNVVSGWFYETHKVFVSNSDIEEQSNLS
jgi:hypothetical protein